MKQLGQSTGHSTVLMQESSRGWLIGIGIEVEELAESQGSMQACELLEQEAGTQMATQIAVMPMTLAEAYTLVGLWWTLR